MAHYAYLDENNIVLQVIVGKDENEPTPDGYDSWEEYYGAKRTSYNTYAGEHLNNGVPFRKNYAAPGFRYDPDFDAFIPPRPYPSWKLDYTTFQWMAPIPVPEFIPGHIWKWGEINQEWISVPIATE
jgi:hypothetical protein